MSTSKRWADWATNHWKIHGYPWYEGPVDTELHWAERGDVHPDGTVPTVRYLGAFGCRHCGIADVPVCVSTPDRVLDVCYDGLGNQLGMTLPRFVLDVVEGVILPGSEGEVPTPREIELCRRTTKYAHYARGLRQIHPEIPSATWELLKQDSVGLGEARKWEFEEYLLRRRSRARFRLSMLWVEYHSADTAHAAIDSPCTAVADHRYQVEEPEYLCRHQRSRDEVSCEADGVPACKWCRNPAVSIGELGIIDGVKWWCKRAPLYELATMYSHSYWDFWTHHECHKEEKDAVKHILLCAVKLTNKTGARLPDELWVIILKFLPLGPRRILDRQICVPPP